REKASFNGPVSLKTPTTTARYVAKQTCTEIKSLANGEKSASSTCCTINPKATTMSPPAVWGPTADSTSLTPIPTGAPAYTKAGTNKPNMAIAYAIATPVSPKGR